MWKIAMILGCLAAGLTSESRAEQRPNLVVILVDDTGFSEVGCDGGEFPTPHKIIATLDSAGRWRLGGNALILIPFRYF